MSEYGAAHEEHGHGGHDEGHGTPHNIKEYYKKQKELNLLLDTTELEHSNAYIKAAEAIRDKDGKVDYNLLKDDKKRDEFIDKLIGHYITEAKKALKSDLKAETDLEKNILLKAYAGVTKHELERTIHSKRNKYTKEAHDGVAHELKEQQAKELGPHVASHLKHEDIESIVDYTGARDLVDYKSMQLNDAIMFLNHYKEGKGAITKEMVEGKHYEKKEDHDGGHEHH